MTLQHLKKITANQQQEITEHATVCIVPEEATISEKITQHHQQQETTEHATVYTALQKAYSFFKLFARCR